MEIEVVVGGQYGSEGKGALAGWLARKQGQMLAIRVAGPNAGHTVVADDGRRWPLRQVPVAAVTNPEADLLIAAGSEVDPEVLWDELASLDEAGYGVTQRLWVHPGATVILPSNRAAETGLVGAIGSTGKGIGSARADRAMRVAPIALDHQGWPDGLRLGAPGWDYRYVQIEGTQGYGLGLHTGFYPHTTSSDCRAIDFLAMAGLSPWQADSLRVWMAIRPYPIRVAGNSGPMYEETTWEDLGLPTEYTTVTKKTRRVGGWDEALVRAAIRANGGTRLSLINAALMMADHRWPRLAGLEGQVGLHDLPEGLQAMAADLRADGASLRALGTGPDTIVEVGIR